MAVAFMRIYCRDAHAVSACAAKAKFLVWWKAGGGMNDAW